MLYNKHKKGFYMKKIKLKKWLYNNEEFDKIILGFEAFVYLIERLNTDEDIDSPIYYVGKKNFFRKEKKGIIEENDWQNYYGSSDWLKKDIKKYGKHNFKRTILYLCKTKSNANYLETFELMKRNVLRVDNLGHKIYYNLNIAGIYLNEPTYFNIKNLNTIKNKNNVNYNKIWINNDNINRLVSKNKSKSYVGKHNWKLGYLIKNECENIDKKYPIKNNKYTWVHDSFYSYKILKSDLDLFLSHNYFHGRLYENENLFIPIIKDKLYQFIRNSKMFIPENWKREYKIKNNKKYYAIKNLIYKSFNNKTNLNQFLKNNKDWKEFKVNKNKILRPLELIDIEYKNEKFTILKKEFNLKKYKKIKKYNPRQKKLDLNDIKVKPIVYEKEKPFFVKIADKFFDMF